MTTPHTVATIGGFEIIELHQMSATLWAARLSDLRWVVADARDIRDGVPRAITSEDVLTARQWEIDPAFDEALDDAEWSLDDRDFGPVALIVILLATVAGSVALGSLWAIVQGVL